MLAGEIPDVQARDRAWARLGPLAAVGAPLPGEAASSKARHPPSARARGPG